MTVEAILFGIVGLVAGVLIALLLDSQTLVRRVQASNAAKHKAEAALQKFQIQHQAIEQQLQLISSEVATAVQGDSNNEETIARQLAEIEASREQMQAAIRSNETLRENLEEAQDRIEELEGFQLAAEEKLAAAVAENNRLVGDVQLMEAEIVALEESTAEQTQPQPGSDAVEPKVVASEAEQAALELEKDSLQKELQQAELANAEQSATIEALQKQVQEMALLRQELASASEKLQTAESHIDALQSKMDDVQTKMSYSGKNQLQLIRGIGPAYAQRLNEFGIHTFADLADCSPEQIASIIKKKNWQAVDLQDWVDEAKALAARLGPDA